jgi:DNA gyrase subunit A
VNVIETPEGHKVAEIVPVREFDDNRYLIQVTQKGQIKKTALSAYSRPRKGGIIGMKVVEDDHLIAAAITEGNDEVIIVTKNGQAVRFQEGKVRSMGRNSQGVRGVSLQGDDEVVGMVVVKDDDVLLTICANGYGKRTPVSDYRLTNRGGKGVINIKTTERNGPVVSVMDVTEDNDVVIITQNGILIRQSIRDVSIIGRNTQGVRLINLDDGDRVIDVARVEKEDDVDEEAEDGDMVNEVSENGGVVIDAPTNGVAEEGIEVGSEEGIEVGLEEGLEEGSEEETEEGSE